MRCCFDLQIVTAYEVCWTDGYDCVVIEKKMGEGASAASGNSIVWLLKSLLGHGYVVVI